MRQLLPSDDDPSYQREQLQNFLRTTLNFSTDGTRFDKSKPLMLGTFSALRCVVFFILGADSGKDICRWFGIENCHVLSSSIAMSGAITIATYNFNGGFGTMESLQQLNKLFTIAPEYKKSMIAIAVAVSVLEIAGLIAPVGVVRENVNGLIFSIVCSAITAISAGLAGALFGVNVVRDISGWIRKFYETTDTQRKRRDLLIWAQKCKQHLAALNPIEANNFLAALREVVENDSEAGEGAFANVFEHLGTAPMQITLPKQYTSCAPIISGVFFAILALVFMWVWYPINTGAFRKLFGPNVWGEGFTGAACLIMNHAIALGSGFALGERAGKQMLSGECVVKTTMLEIFNWIVSCLSVLPYFQMTDPNSAKASVAGVGYAVSNTPINANANYGTVTSLKGQVTLFRAKPEQRQMMRLLNWFNVLSDSIGSLPKSVINRLHSVVSTMADPSVQTQAHQYGTVADTGAARI